MIYLDTNVVVWLAANAIDQLSQSCLDLIDDADEICISPMVLLELDYLHEIEKITQKSSVVYERLRKLLGLSLCEKPFANIVIQASHYNWTRDPFDRIITAQAAIGEDMLLTKDRKILQHYKHAIW